MKILVTGNAGYIGPVLVRHLRKAMPPGQYVGYDAGYFGHCLTAPKYLPERDFDVQHWGDIRSFPVELLDGIDAVVHLAAVSNDPIGNRFAVATEEINIDAGKRLALAAKARGVKHFVFASSCSIYGFADDGAKTEGHALNPLTAYARSKVAMEQALEPMANDDFVVTALRFATACGWSHRLRLDLVLNDFVACALASGEINVLSDGSPWRPLIDVQDMSRAIEWAISRTVENGQAFVAVNAGTDSANYQVKDLADAVARMIPGVRVTINADAPADKRSYRVDFSLFRRLAPHHQPQLGLEQSIARLQRGLESMGFSDRQFRSSIFIRMKVLENQIEAGLIDEKLRWLP
ncbi:MAG: SDR family oxidoreductase [Pseudomonadota bacterium]